MTAPVVLVASGVDPTGGKVKQWVECIVVADFNYGVWPKQPDDSPTPDIMIIVRRDATHGTLYEMVR